MSGIAPLSASSLYNELCPLVAHTGPACYNTLGLSTWKLVYSLKMWPIGELALQRSSILSDGDQVRKSDNLLVNPIFLHTRNLSNWSLGPPFPESYLWLVDMTR